MKTAPQSDAEKADYWSYKYDQNKLTEGIEAQAIIPYPAILVLTIIQSSIYRLVQKYLSPVNSLPKQAF
ncbi:hypothetical protein KUH03_18415 [Sphingobacterium sp. E70]|uniref:hypothetical protein n=1 Tax=Sphingobacterium sp. E70 TaxID=2853439 RepID=UPI00211CBC6A|nr:hypothetical protein [Sphingobacterium sp. E70]ULT28370.1 hypothetical protein KUH03_18415 [Sphingobacterium sp. E70]